MRWAAILLASSALAAHAAPECTYSALAIGGDPSRIDVGNDGRSLRLFHNLNGVLATPSPANRDKLTCTLRLDCEVPKDWKGFSFPRLRQHRDSRKVIVERGSEVRVGFADPARLLKCTVKEIEP